MLSFCGQVKEELCLCMTDRARRFACFYGILLCCRSITPSAFTVQTESEALAQLLPQLAAEVLNGTKLIGTRLPRRETVVYSFTADGKTAVDLYELFGLTKQRRILFDRIPDSSRSALLAGIFLACGSVTDPNKEYHFELNLPTDALYEDVVTLLSPLGIFPKQMLRRGSCLLYVKNCEQIEDLLTYMGAQQATIEIINTEILKDCRNRVNRMTNCEAANYGKSVRAAQRQIADIELIAETVGLETLPPDLREIAFLRLENPEESLRELGQLLDPPMGRSGVNHRLQKISDYAEKLRKGGC